MRRYGEFIEYLLRKDPNIKAVEMDFEGKNILLYSLGGLQPLRDPAEVVPHICRGPATSEHWWRLSQNDQQIKPRSRCCGDRDCDASLALGWRRREKTVGETRKESGIERKMEIQEELFDGFSNLLGTFPEEDK